MRVVKHAQRVCFGHGVRADGVGVLPVRRPDDATVLGALLDVLLLPLELLGRPLVHGAVDAARRDFRVVGAPKHRPHAPAVPAEVAHVLRGVRVVHLHDRAVHRRKELAAVTEAALAARLDGKLLVRAHVVHQQVAQPQLVGKADQHVQAARVERDAERLLHERLLQLQAHVQVVPHAHGLVRRARRDERLLDAGVDPSDRFAVERVREQLEHHLLLLQDVAVRQVHRVHLVVLQRAHQRLLGGRERDGAHAAGRRGGAAEALLPVNRDGKRLDALEHFLVVRLLVHVHLPPLARADEALRAVRDDAVDAAARAG